MRTVLVVLLACGCTGDGGKDDGGSYPPDLPLDAAYTSCEVAGDCAAVELGCCDECNGGLAVATNTASADEVVDLYSEGRCERQPCTEMGCAPWVADCVDGTCSIARENYTTER